MQNKTFATYLNLNITYFPFLLPETGLLNSCARTCANSLASSKHHDLNKHRLNDLPIPSRLMQSTGRMISTSGLQELIKSKNSKRYDRLTWISRGSMQICKFLQVSANSRIKSTRNSEALAFKKIVTLNKGGQLLTLSKRTCVLALQ